MCRYTRTMPQPRIEAESRSAAATLRRRSEPRRAARARDATSSRRLGPPLPFTMVELRHAHATRGTKCSVPVTILLGRAHRHGLRRVRGSTELRARPARASDDVHRFRRERGSRSPRSRARRRNRRQPGSRERLRLQLSIGRSSESESGLRPSARRSACAVFDGSSTDRERVRDNKPQLDRSSVPLASVGRRHRARTLRAMGLGVS